MRAPLLIRFSLEVNCDVYVATRNYKLARQLNTLRSACCSDQDIRLTELNMSRRTTSVLVETIRVMKTSLQ